MTMKGSCTKCAHYGDFDFCTKCNSGNDRYEDDVQTVEKELAAKYHRAIHPTHYPDSRHGDIISICMDNNVGFCEGNIMKYVYRWKMKGGYQDLLKAKEYLNRLLRFYKNKDPNEDYCDGE